MPKPARDRLARLLAGTEPASSDSAMLRLPGDALTLDVADLGPIKTPIRAAQAKQLIGVARPAEFGHGEETLSDESVRDTWVIDPEQVHLGGPNWQAHLDAALEHFCDELGLPDGARLTAELHSLLVYGKGQFFLPHQDSEKHDQMVASMVVTLPSVHTGGELVVDDAGTAQTYSGSRDGLVLVAFYADRRHEVRPVRSGYRVSLTFNLLLTSPDVAATDGPVATASAYLTEHFTTRAVSEYGGRDLGEPTRLAFLLDHEYTQSGLRAGKLKGADAERVATLRTAAEHAGCESVLALAEIKETWDVLAAGDDWGHEWYGDGDEDEDEDEDEEPDRDDDDYELNSLIDGEITLGWWTSPDGSSGETIRLPLVDYEVCAVTPTKSLTPYESEYEGYMGNYGNTLDRWYRRAALVVWPTEHDFAVRAQASPAWALGTLLARIEAGEFERARAEAMAMAPFWRELDPALLAPALRVANGLGDSAAARVVASPFRIERLTAEHAPSLAALAVAYGDAWVLELLDSWQRLERFGGRDRFVWVADALVPLSASLRAHEAEALAAGMADQQWRWVLRQVRPWLESADTRRRREHLAEFGAPLARVLEAATEATGMAIAEQLLAAGDAATGLLVAALRLHPLPPTAPFAAIAAGCRDRLARAAASPVRAEGDWSIAWSGCGCGLCDRLTEFAGNAGERELEWPLAKAGRQHVHRQIDDAELPIRHTTRRQGSPYKLLLTKTGELFRREEEARQQARADFDWLTAIFD